MSYKACPGSVHALNKVPTKGVFLLLVHPMLLKKYTAVRTWKRKGDKNINFCTNDILSISLCAALLVDHTCRFPHLSNSVEKEREGT